MALETVPTFIGGLGGPELVIVFLIAILLFGANKIPKLARSTGEAMGEFQKGREEVEQELEEMKEGPNLESNDSAFDDTTTATEPSTETASESSTDTSAE